MKLIKPRPAGHTSLELRHWVETSPGGFRGSCSGFGPVRTSRHCQQSSASLGWVGGTLPVGHRRGRRDSIDLRYVE